MWRSDNFVDKYGPMLHLLTSETDFEFLAGKERYRPEVAENYRDMRRRTLRSYMIELERDFNEVYSAAAEVAVHNPELARALADCRAAFDRTMRYVRFRLFADRFIPFPSPRHAGSRASAAIDVVRKLMLGVLPKPRSAEDLLNGMNALRDHLIGMTG